MKVFLTILKKQGVALAILVGSFLVVRWVVAEFRPPGAMTVIEAQAMDMKAMRAPIGVVPVGTDYALERTVGGTETFPATIVALSDEDVVARVPGLVSEVLVYPGDRVRAGELVARISADEYDAKAQAGLLSAASKQSEAEVAEQRLARDRAALKTANIKIEVSDAGVEAAEAELRATENHVSHLQGEVQEIVARREAAQAELDYARLDYDREKLLFEGGAISRDDLDQAYKRITLAQAMIGQVDAQRMQKNHELEARYAKRDAAVGLLRQARAGVNASRAMVLQAEATVTAAEGSLRAKEREVQASRAMAMASGALSSYTELRASDDGVVTERLVSPGTPVMPGRAILRIKVDRVVRVQADLPQRLASSVLVGSTVRISFEDRSIDAQVTSVFPFVDGRTRTFRIEAKISNEDGAWQVGSYAKIEVATSVATRVLSVRNEAVKTGTDGSHYVWLLVGEQTQISEDAIFTCTMHPEVEHVGPGDCPICSMPLVPVDATGNVRAEKRPVSIGPSDARYTAILDGLAEGDTVTWAGDEELFPSAAVQAVEWDENGPVELPKGAGMAGMDMGADGGMNMGDSEADDSNTGDNQATSLKGHEGHAHGPDDSFTCEMHPEVHKSEEGTCPICEMDLVPIEDGN